MTVINFPGLEERTGTQFRKLFYEALNAVDEPVRSEAAADIAGYITKFTPPGLNGFEIKGDFTPAQIQAVGAGIQGYSQCVAATLSAAIQEIIKLRVEKAMCQMMHGD